MSADREARSAAVHDREARSAAVHDREARSAAGHDPRAAYQTRLEAAQRDAAGCRRHAGHIALLRFAAFGVLCAGLSAMLPLESGKAPLPAALSGPTAGIGLVAFVALVIYHGRVLQRLTLAELLVALNQAGLRRLDGTWSQGAPPPPPPEALRPPYARDLDLYGPASLQQLCDVTRTRYGEEALWRALSLAARPAAEPSEARGRQEAVRELADLLDLRQRLEAAGSLMAPSGPKPDPEPFLRWAEGPPLLAGRPLVKLLRLLPLLTLALALASLVAPLQGALLALVLVQGAGVLWSSLHVTRLITCLATREPALLAYVEMLSVLESAPLASTHNRALQAALRGQGDTALGPAAQLARLRGDYGMLMVRQNPLAWLPLNLLLLWDLQFALRIEAWQAQVGPQIRGWLAALGELEARASLATLAHDNPGWAWPTLTTAEPGAPTFRAVELGHPLIPAARRVGNDVELAAPGGAWLVTGSNMSGKSTLLRAIGLGQVLAQAGAPLPAREATLRPLTLRTVIRVDDDLAKGLSHFYAELTRLKETIDEQRPGRPPLCYLLDEILHGTNTRERELGAEILIKTLCQRGAVGVVTTHDVALQRLEQETGGAVRNVHFTEQVADGRMSFDYRLRPGPVRSSNALLLMRLCGMDLDFSISAAAASPS